MSDTSITSTAPGHRAAVLAQTGIDVEGCRHYVLDRQTPAGGFCFYRYGLWGVEEPNAVDTCAAIASLVLLECAVPQLDDVVTWLHSLQDRSGGYASVVIADAALGALHRLGLAPSRDPRGYLQGAAARIGLFDPCLFDPRVREWSGWLADAHRCLRWWRAYGMPLDQPQSALPAVLKSLEDPEGGFVSSRPSVIETWHALRILTLLDQGLPAHGLLFLRRCEHPLFGMTLAPGSTATSIETLHDGGRALRLYGANPTHHEAILRFVANCQASTGGFGRTSGALPNLVDTFRALAVVSQDVDCVCHTV